MPLQLYAIFDKKTISFSQPYVYKHVEEAIRSLKMTLEDPKSLLARHAADYALYLVGHFDQETGRITAPAHNEPSHAIELLALFPSIPLQGVSNAQA